MAENTRGRPRKPTTYHRDGWNNYLTGLGQAQDKANKTVYQSEGILPDSVLTDMYIGGGLATRVVNVVADDMTREWVSIDDPEVERTLSKAADELSLELQFNISQKWARLHGGAFILIGADDGQGMDRELNLRRIKRVSYFKPMGKSCINLQDSEWDTNPLSYRFGKINVYSIRMRVGQEYIDIRAHHSRVIEVHGDPFPIGDYTAVTEEQQYWGMSALQVVHESLRDLGGITQSTVNIIYGFVSGVYKFKGLNNLLATDPNNEGQTLLNKRLQAIDAGMSVINAAVLDADEEYVKNYTTVAGLPELFDRYMLLLCGDSSIPVTRLFGRSPAGLNATGEADLRNYYDLIETNQQNRLYGPLCRAYTILAAWKGVEFDTSTLRFNSLYQLTETERVDNEQKKAATAQTMANTAITLINAGIRDVGGVAEEMGYADEAHIVVAESDPPDGAEE